MGVNTKIQVRRDTAANWTSVNPTLAAGEIGFETDTSRFKVGTGSAAWTSLAYQGIPTGGAAGTVLVKNSATDYDTSWSATLVPSGSIQQYAGLSIPTGWLLCAGQTLSRSTYTNLFTAVTLDRGAITSISNANPCVVTYTSHGLVAGDGVYLTTSGALPSGLTTNTTYYVQNPTANTFNLNTSQANAIANSATGRVATTTAGSGTHTLVQAPWGGITSLLFAIPDLRGRIGVGVDNMGGSDASRLSVQNAVGLGGGEENVTLTAAQIAAHTHTAGTYDAFGIGNASVAAGGDYQAITATGSTATTRIGVNANTGGGGSHNNMQPYVLLNYIIKT